MDYLRLHEDDVPRERAEFFRGAHDPNRTLFDFFNDYTHFSSSIVILIYSPVSNGKRPSLATRKRIDK
ncbi:protein of unknown function [Methanoculleus bourgensis]|uniref:Uncharacterized protein n=1 Tax=Methanoculleus bourgensis TaxID=83986 RepID=A0A0X8XYF2_9EURY|nr:protein of unknown function [Methanoculleus bourgensis]